MIHVSVWNKEMQEQEKCQYKYHIQSAYSTLNITAFKTDLGFKQWLINLNLVGQLKGNNIDYSYLKKSRQYKINANITTSYIWKLSDIPSHHQNILNSYTDLCNGSLVTCYSATIKNSDSGTFEVHIYKPNPNAKDIYIPLSFKESYEFNKIYG